MSDLQPEESRIPQIPTPMVSSLQTFATTDSDEDFDEPMRILMRKLSKDDEALSKLTSLTESQCSVLYCMEESGINLVFDFLASLSFIF